MLSRSISSLICYYTPQGSILCPLLFNNLLYDLFFASYADEYTPCALEDRIDHVIKSVEDVSVNSFKWFLENQMKANSDKCHLITRKQSCVNLKIENINIENSTCEKLIGVKVDNKLNFNERLGGIIKKSKS